MIDSNVFAIFCPSPSQPWPRDQATAIARRIPCWRFLWKESVDSLLFMGHIRVDKKSADKNGWVFGSVFWSFVELWSNLVPWTRHLISWWFQPWRTLVKLDHLARWGLFSLKTIMWEFFMILYSCLTPICSRNCYCLRPRKVSCPHITWQVEARDVPRKFSIACGSGLEDEISFWDGLGFKEGMPFSHNTWRPPAMLQRHLHPTHPRVVRRSCCKPSSRPYVACIRREAIHSSFSWFILQGWTLHVPPKRSPPRIWNTGISDPWRWCLKIL